MAVNGSKALQKEVLNKELCSACGACVSLCPYFDMVAGKAVMIEPCTLSEGKCYGVCPRTYIDVPILDTNLFGSPRSDLAIGSHLRIVKTRAKDVETRSAAQYGGVVSALTAYALETGEIDAAVLARSATDKINPKPTLAKNREDVLQCSGSKYVVCPILTEVVGALKKGIGRIGIVGTPCQVTAVRKMQVLKSEPKTEEIGLVIGLFCTWALSPHAYHCISEFVDPLKVMKLDVPPPPANVLVIETEKRKVDVPLDVIREFILPACNTCFDMTSEFADISVGTVEGEANWNTVIVRTRLGEEFFQRAIDAGVVETTLLEEERINHLYEASLNRKKKALMEMESGGISYLAIGDEDRSKLLS